MLHHYPASKLRTLLLSKLCYDRYDIMHMCASHHPLTLCMASLHKKQTMEYIYISKVWIKNWLCCLSILLNSLLLASCRHTKYKTFLDNYRYLHSVATYTTKINRENSNVQCHLEWSVNSHKCTAYLKKCSGEQYCFIYLEFLKSKVCELWIEVQASLQARGEIFSFLKFLQGKTTSFTSLHL